MKPYEDIGLDESRRVKIIRQIVWTAYPRGSDETLASVCGGLGMPISRPSYRDMSMIHEKALRHVLEI